MFDNKNIIFSVINFQVFYKYDHFIKNMNNKVLQIFYFIYKTFRIHMMHNKIQAYAKKKFENCVFSYFQVS